ncbi:GDSL-type esterase/lipase family protein [Paenibacillus sp. MMS20-IR301]|uniref:GDSL-type esterase/lipase family protein n=1 Tax=Paenibacillus sp. MMS20-IR301 TaxID=2895946 RepID=UPI0028E6673A|nr:GDSL-type esterase/lipase family protein [Paenibacillus sp. MMS20-IR301]WNS44570.1 GDSL-type esterase/lipase family protein [Paenibacillus sp. MMS20-IR301]
MKDSKWTWRAVSLVSILATLLLITGFVYAVGDILNPKGEVLLSSLPQQTAEPTAAAGNELKVLALGDSLAKGTGDNLGKGFVKRALEQLSADGGKAELLGNMGINGLTTAGLQSKLQEDGVQYALRQANVVLVSIGGNDLFRGSNLLESGSGTAAAGSPASPESGVSALGTDTAGSGANNTVEGSKPVPTASTDELTPESLLAALPDAAKRLGSILERIAEINPQAQIYYVGLYNPFGDIADLLVPGNQAVTAWNNAAMDIINTHSNMTLVPTFDLFNRHLDKYLSNDHFHPNGDGYQRMSERIVQAVR